MSQVPKNIKEQNCSLLKKTSYAGSVCFEAWDAGLSWSFAGLCWYIAGLCWSLAGLSWSLAGHVLVLSWSDQFRTST